MSMLVLQQCAADREAISRVSIDTAAIADDHVDYKDVTVKKPWGFEREVYRSAACSAWRLQLDKRTETSLHCHLSKTAFMFLSHGSALVETLTGRYSLEAGDVLIIEPGVFHRTKTMQGAVLMEVEFPPNRNDLVRLQDRYGRVGKGYERAAG